MKKLLTFILVLAMVMSVSSVAMAAVTDESELQNAINAGGTVTLDNDITLTNTLTIPAGATVTLDLNGCTISQEKAQTGAYSMIQNNGTLIIMDSSDPSTGKITYKDTTTYTSYINYVSNTITNEGTLTVISGTIENLSNSTVAHYGYPYTIDNNSTTASVLLNVEGGTLKCESYCTIRLYCNSTTNTNVANISGGKLFGGIELQNPNGNANSGELNITGGDIDNYNVKNAVFIFNPGGSDGDMVNMKASISAGNIDGPVTLNKTYNTSNNTGFDDEVISGGAFSENPESNGLKIKNGAVAAQISSTDASGNSSTTYAVGHAAIEEAAEEAAKKSGAENVTVTVTQGSVDFGNDLPDGVGVANQGDGDVKVNDKQVNKPAPGASPEPVIVVNPKPESNPSTGGGYYYVAVRYNGGNSFSTDRTDVPVAVLIDGQPVGFTGNGSNFVVDCINPGASRITIVWNTIKVDARFTPDANAYCGSVSIPKTGDMPFWAAVAAFFGF